MHNERPDLSFGSQNASLVVQHLCAARLGLNKILTSHVKDLPPVFAT